MDSHILREQILGFISFLDKSKSLDLFSGSACLSLNYAYIHKLTLNKEYLNASFINVEELIENTTLINEPAFCYGFTGRIWTILHLHNQKIIEIDASAEVRVFASLVHACGVCILYNLLIINF